MDSHGGIQKVQRTIARGGFGVVDEVLMNDGTRLARKQFLPQFPGLESAMLEKLRARFEREVRVQSSLDSSSFIPVIEADLTGSSPSYLMPLADRNLVEQIEIDRANGQAPVFALADVLNALEELHRLGYVHRDLKPQNILLLQNVWRLTDFGLVLPTSTATTKLTSTDSAWGTAGYCAPEQARDFRGVGPGADIYAFGCILHDIFVNKQRIPYARQTGPGPIGSVIEKCTEVKPEKRFKNVQALRGALLTLLASAAPGAPSQQAEDWASDLANASSWNVEKLEAFASYVSNDADDADRFVVFKAMDEDALGDLQRISGDAWKHVALEYCDWMADTSFDFAYCDVLAHRVQYVFDNGDLECKGAAALCAADLARSHNRWSVMGTVLTMCGPALDDVAAQRIAVEIRAADAIDDFRRCAEGISRSINAYHPLIAEVLKKA